MKKLIAIVAVVALITACNSGSNTTTPATNDSTVIKADTTLVVDSTTVGNVNTAPEVLSANEGTGK